MTSQTRTVVDPRWQFALVTGASSGIGREFARELALRGTDLVVVARREDRLEELADDLHAAHGTEVEVVAADLTDATQRGRVEERLRDEDRPVDLLVNNAGFGTYGPFVKQDVARESAEVELNALTVVRLAHVAAAGMVERGGGAIINVSSVAGFQPLPYNATYAATKAFVTTFSEGIHEELRQHGVTVTALCPGFVRTEFQDSADIDPSPVPDFAWLDPKDVVLAALRDVERGAAVCVPGLGYKLLAMMTRLTPRWAVRRGAGMVGDLG